MPEATGAPLDGLVALLGHSLDMVLLALPLAVLLGGPLGVLLFQLARASDGAARLAKAVHRVCSVPAIVLLAALIAPIGALTSPALALALAAIPCFARLVAHALHGVPPGLIDAAHAMGASPLQIVTRVLVVEARAQLVMAISLLAIILLAYVAITAAGLWLLLNDVGHYSVLLGVSVAAGAVLVTLIGLIDLAGQKLAQRLERP